MSDRDDIKTKLDIVEVIREYVPVKAVGANFQALCPFHNEKTPSFVISPEKQIWHCFGCGRGGDIFSFVMEKENLNFIEAMRLLANKAGIVLKYENTANRSQRNRLLDILELAGKYYQHLLQSSHGQKAKEYLLKRGLKAETIEDWKLGYSLDAWSSLYEFLLTRPKLGKKYSDEEIVAAGLIIKKEKNVSDGRQYYDRFRDRIMFPIFDVNHNLVAFTARINPEKEKTEKMGKYINSPQTEVYDKSKILFGLNRAKDAIKRLDFVIVVEGQMDAISCHNHGFDNTVASSGTALTNEQISLIKRFTNNIALAFDMDAAGQAAVDRGIKEALAQGLNIKIISLINGKDPDDCLRHNPDDFKKSLAAAQPILTYYFNKISAGLDLSKLDNKTLVRDQMFKMIALVKSPSDQGYWLKKLSEELDFSENDIREEFQQSFKNKKNDQAANIRQQNSQENLASIPVVNRLELLSELFLALIIKFPEIINFGLEILEPEQLHNLENTEFYKTLIIYYNKADSLNYDEFHLFLTEQDLEKEKLLEKLTLLGEKEFYNHNFEQAKQVLIQVTNELKKYHFQQKIKSLEKKLTRAEEDNNQAELNQLMLELKNTTEELKKLI